MEVDLTTLDLIKDLFAYDAWARGQFVAVLKTLSEGEFTRNLGPGLDSLAKKWAHLTDADMLWLSRIVDGVSPPNMPDAARFKTTSSFLQHLMTVGHRKAQLIAALKDADLVRMIAYTNTRGESFSQPLSELLQHLVAHGQYHRGQMASCLRALGKQPPETDLVVYYRTAAK